MDTTIEVHDLTIAYDDKPVVWDIDLSIPRGKLVCILGPNGAGKTTLLKGILGLERLVTGNVLFPQLETKRNKIAYVSQSDTVDWDFPACVLDVVMMGRYGYLGMFARPGRKARELSRVALEKVGMLDFENRQIGQLSGGQKQRVFLARALAQDAEIYLLDEPFKGVDIKTEKIIVDQLKSLRDEGKTVVVVHHDLETVREYFDWAVLINVSVAAAGPVDEVFTKDKIARAFSEVAEIEFEAGQFSDSSIFSAEDRQS